MAKKVSKTKSTKKNTSVKKATKVEEPKEEIVEVVKKEEKVEVKKKGLNNKLIGTLYAMCSVIWIISGYLNFKSNTSTESDTLAYIDIALGVLWMALAVLYFIREKKNK